MSNLERELAREVQERTFPRRIPQVSGFEVFGRTVPAAINNGDFYDAIGVIPRENQRGFVLDPSDEVKDIVLLLGDATGHGMAAALMATELRALIRASIRLGVFHRDLTAMMNAQLVEDLAEHHFVTLLMGRLNTASASFRWVSFGQGPLWHYHAADGRVEDLAPHLPPLGIMPELGHYEPTETTFEPGDILLALSDGFPETMNLQQELLGEAPLKQLLGHCADQPIQVLASEFWGMADSHSGNQPLRDDRTLLIVRRMPTSDSS